jgi:argininosuccinate lyase
MKLWQGRFQKRTSSITEDFNSSIAVDQRMYREDILGSMAHARMLGECGIIPGEDSVLIINGLQSILEDADKGLLEFTVEAEDIHMNVETLLIERIGEAGKRLHTGRSRNDQVALDFRMYMKKGTKEVEDMVLDLLKVILGLAKEHKDTIMAGYTHLQKAQPVTLGHHLMAYFQMFSRDLTRFIDSEKRMDHMPLGSGALAGTTYPIDRNMVAAELGFGSITENSMDGVSDRDFALEFLGASSILMMHLSRFCEEIIIWNSNEFGYVEMDDAFSTGSSIMPQKKNPDIAELVRGKTGRVYGDLVALLTIMKGLPLAYNKDMQEDKETTFDALDTVKACLAAFTPMLSTATFNKDAMMAKLRGGFLNATDAADYLVMQGVPFRSAHEVIGRMVNYCIINGKALDDLSQDEFKSFSDKFGNDILEFIKMENCLQRRKTYGGPSAAAMDTAIHNAGAFISSAEALKK